MRILRSTSSATRLGAFYEPDALIAAVVLILVAAGLGVAGKRWQVRWLPLVGAVLLAFAALLVVVHWVGYVRYRRHFRRGTGLRVQRKAEPGAAPNGGPATPADNLGVTGGPPSVS